MQYQTPGVYVEEIASLPPSVVAVSTAIPAFLGFTEKRPGAFPANDDIVTRRIGSLLEYVEQFGGPEPTQFAATVDENGEFSVSKVAGSGEDKYLLFYALDAYFKNGGGPCYVVSVGDFTLAAADPAQPFLDGLDQLKQEDEPTLIVMPDAVHLDEAKYYSVANAALAHCDAMADRFAILDVWSGTPADDKTEVEAFRDGVAQAYLSYGAAYYPNLETSITPKYDETDLEVTLPPETEGGPDVVKQLSDLAGESTALYNNIRKWLGNQRVTMPPGAVMAGVYARVDRDRGVWKAPANVGLSSVVAPTVRITDDDQQALNIDADGGKSINAIRAFTGKGTLVWGSRTLAGNDNEWRYVPVRRLFIMIEESAKKASGFAVFEPNDATTWLKVRGMLEAFLLNLWERGALQGSTPEAAYYVNVGLGQTMSAQDILEGRMIVEIGIAAVRPAEFIVLRFSHALAQS